MMEYLMWMEPQTYTIYVVYIIYNMLYNMIVAFD